jgi:hypothetical protein
MAQLVARFHGMEEVRGSNPLSSTNAVARQGGGFCDSACGFEPSPSPAQDAERPAQVVEHEDGP